MAVSIVTEARKTKHPWILERAALEAEQAGEGIEKDMTYFINYALYRPVGGTVIGHFTHLEKKGPTRDKFLDTIHRCDYYTVTCDITGEILTHYGAKEEKIWKIPYGSDERMKKDIVFGVVGRTYPSGRKRERLVKKALGKGYDFRAWGKGWPCPVEDDWDSLPGFYRKIDYLVVTADNEGGPVPVIDAIRAGVPVIAPDVGWCWEYPVIRYKDESDLFRVLHDLTHPPTWKDWREEHKKLFSCVE